jgi:transmembrane sensor
MEPEKVDFKDLIVKFFAGEITDDEFSILKAWLNESTDNRRIFDHENELWQETSFQTINEHYNIEHGWKSLSTRLGIGKGKKLHVKVMSRASYIVLVSAACFACVIAIGSLLLQSQKSKPAVIPSALTTITTREGEKAHVVLPDSTEVVLNSGSTIKYDAGFNQKDRIVAFSGEAFFDVATNHDKPFIVKLEHMNVVATGTRFNIFSFSNENRVETTLVEGSINVSVAGKEPVRMKSGEQMVYFVKSGDYKLSEVATDTYTSWKENKLRFNDTPFEEVLRRIGRKYNVRFEVTSHDLLQLRYTATFIDESIEEVMQMLQTVSPITYKIYNMTTISDKTYTRPRILVGKRKELINTLNPNLKN